MTTTTIPRTPNRIYQPDPTHPWDKAAAQLLTRPSVPTGALEALDPGVNFFVQALEALGAHPKFSCEGHPVGFYVAFDAPYELALEIKAAGFFRVEIEGTGYWSIRKSFGEIVDGRFTQAKKAKVLTDAQEGLRWAAEAWLKRFDNRLAFLA
jgi:hypothetical protein